MISSPFRLTLALLVALGAAPALAEHESVDAHAKGTTQTIVLDGNDVRPTTTTMSHADVISFLNYSSSPVQVTFTEPADLEKKIRCGLVHGKEKSAPAAPWAVFTWKDGKLVGTVPPGRFASVCSLEPGTYTFVTAIVGHGSRTEAPKGQLVVK